MWCPLVFGDCGGEMTRAVDFLRIGWLLADGWEVPLGNPWQERVVHGIIQTSLHVNKTV